MSSQDSPQKNKVKNRRSTDLQAQESKANEPVMKEISLKGKRTNKVYKIQYQGDIDSEDMENYRAMVDEWENEELGLKDDDD